MVELYTDNQGAKFLVPGTNGKITRICDLPGNKNPHLFDGSFVVYTQKPDMINTVPGKYGMVKVSDGELSTYIKHAELSDEINAIESALPEHIKLLYVEFGKEGTFHMLYGGKGRSTTWAIHDPISGKYSYVDSFRRYTLKRELRKLPIMAVNVTREQMVKRLKQKLGV